jgi:catechol 2,3-dioxygenase-like lactoylglutathione lyase family enzyme
MIPLSEISHVRLAVTDMARAEKFYGEVLGLKLLDRAPDGKELVYGLRNGEHFLILHHSSGQHPRAKYIHGPHVALELAEEDYDRILPQIEKLEVYWGPNKHKTPWHERALKTAYFYDPDNNRLQLTPLGGRPAK